MEEQSKPRSQQSIANEIGRETRIQAVKASALNERMSERTPARRTAILHGIEIGMSLITAAAATRMNANKVKNWYDDDADFAADVDMAESTFEANMLARIEAAAEDPKGWTAAAWKLERIKPQVYARRTVITGKDDAATKTEDAIRTNLDKLDLSELEKIASGKQDIVTIAASGRENGTTIDREARREEHARYASDPRFNDPDGHPI